MSGFAFLDAHCGVELPLIAGGLSTGFVERREYLALVPHGWADFSLLVDEETLRKEPYRAGMAWRWRPGFFAGQVEAELRDARGVTVHRYTLDVAPEPGKLGASFFAGMVNELRSFRAGMLLGTESAHFDIGASGGFQSLNLQYGRLRAYGSLFVRAVRQVAERPIFRPEYIRVQMPAHRVQYVDHQTLRALARTPAVAVLSSASEPAFEPRLLDVPGTYESVDNAPNHAILYVVRAVLARVSRVQEQLDYAIRRGSEETRTQLVTREPERTRVLSFLREALNRIQRASPFDSVRKSELTTAGLNAISASPAYARACRLAWWILRAGIDADETLERQWMAPTWEIFERWCFLQSLRAVASVVDADVSQWQIKFKGDCVAVAELPVHRARVRVTMQDTFRAWDVSDQSRLSVSGERRPDLTIVWTDASRDIARWMVLDAKYTVRRENILAAMESAHVYQDALRLDGQRPCLSLLMTPARCEASWLMDEEFIERERVGVVNAVDSDAVAAAVRKVVAG